MQKRILLITPRFYGTEDYIRSTLEDLGFEAVWIENRSLPLDYYGTRAKLRRLRKFCFLIFAPRKRYLKHQFKGIANHRFDILFSINGNIICKWLFRKLKAVNPDLFSVIYLWDSSQMYSWNKEVSFFDRAFTFDIEDSKHFSIEYKPNFYIKSENDLPRATEFDLCFIGKFSLYRYLITGKLKESGDIGSVRHFIKLFSASRNILHSRFLYFIFTVFPFGNEWIKEYTLNFKANEGLLPDKNITTEALEFAVAQQIMHSSNVILDLPYPSQSGYTHRLIEALANGKKVITTNNNILTEEFYDARQVRIIDSFHPVIDTEWVRSVLSFSVHPDLKELELSKWLKSVLSLESHGKKN